jgi:RNA-directed DNA polymerase
MFSNFTLAVSKEALKSMRATTRKYNLRNRTDLKLTDIARWCNPILQGWLNYYGKYNRSALYPVWRHFNKSMVAWAMRKYKPFNNRKTKATGFIEGISKKQPKLFAHWRAGMVGAFA